jgi:hypothetical protein
MVMLALPPEMSAVDHIMSCIRPPHGRQTRQAFSEVSQEAQHIADL